MPQIWRNTGCSIANSPHKLFEWLHLAEYWYNTLYHSTLGSTPFQVLYGHPPKHLPFHFGQLTFIM